MRYLFAIRCLDCGHQLHHQADGTVTPKATAAIAACTHCGLQHRIDLHLTPIRTDRPQSTRVIGCTETGNTTAHNLHKAITGAT